MLSTFFDRLKAGLQRTRNTLLGRVQGTPEELEAALLGADVGLPATQYLIEQLRRKSGDRIALLKGEIIALLSQVPWDSPRFPVSPGKGPGTGDRGKTVTVPSKPYVVMLVGVNGSGKTTTAGKLAHIYRRQGRSVLVAASDTYRDAAAPQLQVWVERAGVEIVYSERGQDAAAVAFDAVAKARARNTDIVLVDTAGRLHTRKELMAEARKIKRVIAKALPGAPHEMLLVLDATVGQNGIIQAQRFDADLGLTGVIVTKLDGTAKGGVLIPIALELKLPIRYVGVGENLEDLDEFSVTEFTQALLGE
jgi:fused signal recognition particle receptor